MKIAVCLSGLNKNHEICHKSIKENLIEPYDCDLFCSFWHKTDEECEKIFKDYYPTLIDFEYFSNMKPEFENWEWKYHMLEPHKNPTNLISMYYKIARTNQMRKDWELSKNIKYDAVIRLRPDVFLKTIPKLPEVVKDRIIYIPPVEERACFGVNDQFFMCAPHTYSVITDNMYYRIKPFARFLPIHGELYFAMFSFFEGFGTSTFLVSYDLLNDGGPISNNI